jgi:exosome complex component RRP43
LKQQSEAESWVLADPDSFEEDVCNETLTVVVDNGELLRIEKHGGVRVGKEAVAECVSVATKAWKSLKSLNGSV